MILVYIVKLCTNSKNKTKEKYKKMYRFSKDSVLVSVNKLCHSSINDN